MVSTRVSKLRHEAKNWCKELAFPSARLFMGSKVGEELAKAVLAHDIISFDLFDTLVVRACPKPTNVFDLVERAYNRRHLDSPIQSFARCRRQAEQTARSKSDGKEVTLDQIYDCIDYYSYDMCSELRVLELDAEVAVCQPNAEMLALYQFAREMGKTVIVTTDMYLPRKTIDDIMTHCGYGDCERVFLSSETGVDKRSGKQFLELCETLEVAPDAICHIGDHPFADYLVPKKLGVDAILYKRSIEEPRYIKCPSDSSDANSSSLSIDQGVVWSLIRNGLRPAMSLHARVGYEVIGPLLVGYCLWLHKIVEGIDDSEIWFLSREGHLLKKAYEILFPGDSDVTRYVGVSRIALCRAEPEAARSYKDFIRVFSSLMRDVNTIGDMCAIAGIPCDESVLEEYGVNKDSRIDEAESIDSIFDAIMHEGTKRFTDQRTLLRDYLVPGDNSSATKVISDIGWAGTMQILLEDALGIKTVGAYLAVSDFRDNERYRSLDRRGYICNAEQWRTKGVPLRFTQSAMETLFLGAEGSVNGYVRTDDGAEPVRDESSSSSKMAQYITESHDAALEFVRSFVETGLSNIMGTIANIVAIEPYLAFASRPSDETLRFFDAFEFHDGVNKSSFSPTKRLPLYLTQPKALLSELQSNNSKAIWLYGLLRLPLPYVDILGRMSGIGIKSDYERTLEGATL